MKRVRKKVATDRKFVVALSRGLDVLRAFHPRDGLLGNQEIAARTNLPKPTVSRLTYTLTKLGYLTQVARFEKYQLAPPAMAIGYAALANLGIRDLAEPHMRKLAQEMSADVAVGARDRLSMIYFAQSRGCSAIRTVLDTGIRIPVATTAMGRAYLFTIPDHERMELLDRIKGRAGTGWPKIKDGIDRAGEAMAKYGFTISTGDWIEDVYAVGVGLRMNDGTGPYAFNCGAPAFKFNEERLKGEVGPRLVAMVKEIEAVLNGAIVPAPKLGKARKSNSEGGKVAREVAGSRQA
jgi:DNA-binding IclR family transcriptional regulator